MKKKTLMSAVLAAAIVTSGLVAGHVYANPQAKESGSQPSYHSLSPEKQKQYDAIMEEFSEKREVLRDKLQAKQIEIDTFARSTNPNPEAVAKVAQEIVSLRKELRNERKAMAKRIFEETGLKPAMRPDRPGRGHGPDFDKGYWGHGPRMMRHGMTDEIPCPMWRGFHPGYGHRGPCGAM